MGRFVYLSSEDHARWFVRDIHEGIGVSADNIRRSGHCRVDMREWINSKCQGTVYAWNRTSTPAYGEANWGSKVMPQGDVMMFFEHDDDAMLFKLTWL